MWEPILWLHFGGRPRPLAPLRLESSVWPQPASAQHPFFSWAGPELWSPTAWVPPRLSPPKAASCHRLWRPPDRSEQWRVAVPRLWATRDGGYRGLSRRWVAALEQREQKPSWQWGLEIVTGSGLCLLLLGPGQASSGPFCRSSPLLGQVIHWTAWSGGLGCPCRVPEANVCQAVLEAACSPLTWKPGFGRGGHSLAVGPPATATKSFLPLPTDASETVVRCALTTISFVKPPQPAGCGEYSVGLHPFSENTEGPPSGGSLGTQVGAALTAVVWGCAAPRADGTAGWGAVPDATLSGPTLDARGRV